MVSWLQGVGAWAAKWPTPWDVLASAAAFGSWFVAWRERRDRRAAGEPIIAATCDRLPEGGLRVRLQITNRADHDLEVGCVRVLAPKGALLSASGHVTPSGGWQMDAPAAAEANLAMHLKRAGEEAQHIDRFALGYGDRGHYDLSVFLPESKTSLRLGITYCPFRHDARPRERRMWIRNIPPITSTNSG